MSPVGKVEIVAENRLTGFLKGPRNKVMGNVPDETGFSYTVTSAVLLRKGVS